MSGRTPLFRKVMANAALLTTIGFIFSCALCFVLAARGMRNAEGQAVRMAGSTQDIHDRKLAEAQLKDAVKTGEVQLGETGTTDGTLESQGLVVLDKQNSCHARYPARRRAPLRRAGR